MVTAGNESDPASTGVPWKAGSAAAGAGHRAALAPRSKRGTTAVIPSTPDHPESGDDSGPNSQACWRTAPTTNCEA